MKVRPNYYREDGTPYLGKDAALQWAKDFEKKNRRVAEEYLPDGQRVSTVFLGLDHNYDGVGPPLIYETMVFRKGSWEELYCARYATRQQAIEGHALAVGKFNKMPIRRFMRQK